MVQIYIIQYDTGTGWYDDPEVKTCLTYKEGLKLLRSIRREEREIGYTYPNTYRMIKRAETIYEI